MGLDARTHNRFLNEHNRLVAEQNALVERHNRLVRQHDSFRVVNRYITEIGGGIDLRPKNFRVEPRRGSQIVQELRSKGAKATNRFEPEAPAGSWIRSRSVAVLEAEPIGQLRHQIVSRSSRKKGGRFIQEYQVNRTGRYWLSEEQTAGGWRDQLSRNDGRQRERYFDSDKKELHVVDRAGEKVQEHIVASTDSGNRIVFQRAANKNVANPGVPPFWGH
jgi:hypothetical protein